MANTFWRQSVIGGDSGAWGPYVLANEDALLGVLTSKLYNDGGALKVSVGKIGINNGTNKGICDIDTVTTVDMSGVSNSIWAAIEMSVSGTAVTFTAVDIAAATDPAALPASFKAAYVGAKGGFYLTATKRLVGLAWKNAGGVLEGIIQTIGSKDQWEGYSQSNDANDVFFSLKKEDGQVKDIRTAKYSYSGWNKTNPLSIVLVLDWANMKRISVINFNDTGTSMVMLSDYDRYGNFSVAVSTNTISLVGGTTGEFAAKTATYGTITFDFL